MSDAPQQRRSFGGNQNGQQRSQGARPSGPYNANLARFKRQNPGNGPHGFGGTYKKGEKGGLRPTRDGEEIIPLAERGLRRTTAPVAAKPAATSSAASNNSTTAIKSKIRDLTRLLKKPDLDPTIKKHKEHELKLVQKALEDKQKENAAAKIDAKYKHIKFYERRKITRKLAGLQRSLATLYSKSGGDAMSAEEKQIRKEQAKWQLDLDYVDHYPSGEKYISLFRSAGDKADDDSDDEEDKKEGAKKKDAASEAAAAAALETARAAIRKRVAQAKANAVRLEREAAGTVAPQKRKREDTSQDLLFQEDAEEETPKPTKAAKKDNKPSEETQADDFMVSASDDDEEEDDAAESSSEEEEPTPAPKSKKQKQ